ncbi:MAG: efflux RND transporter periplasmic adaptor subunit [Gemmatimonadota bacterium]
MSLIRSSRHQMRTLPSLRLPLASVILLLVFTAACSKKPEQRARPPVPVVVTKARLADVPYTIEANGVVVPLKAANVGSQVEGIIQRVAFAEGQEVKQGQVLFEIDSRPYRASYSQALANLARDKANADNAQLEAERYATLAAKDYVTKQQADLQRATAAATAATMAATQAAVSTAKFNLDNTTIRAPISGRTGALLVKEGNLVHANGAAPLVVINQVSPILVRFAIPATQLPLLQKYGADGKLSVTATPSGGSDQAVDPGAPAIGLSIGRSDPGTESAAGGRGGRRGGGEGSAGEGGGGRGAPQTPTSSLATLVQTESGTLTFIDNAVDTTTGTVLLKASFPNPNQRLWVGQFVATNLRLFVEQNALVLPAQAIVTGQQGPYVYVITDSGTAQQRMVTIERTAGPMTILASGVKNGDQVVTDGQSRLTPNARVSIMTPQGAAGGGGRRGGRGRGAPGEGSGGGGSQQGERGAGAAAPGRRGGGQAAAPKP